jgi:hypothetical protein
MERFKKGTKVVCLEYGQQTEALEKGKIYTVIGTKETYGVFVEGLTDWWFDHRFIPVSELEPFAVKFYNADQMNELIEYALSMEMPYRTASVIDVYYNFNTQTGRSGTSNKTDHKTLTFEQFKNNEHLMNTKNTGTVDCSAGNGIFVKELVVSPEFVKRAHRAACSDWKELIEKEFPSIFPPTYRLGDKFKIDGGNQIYLLSQADGKVCLINLHTGNAHTKSFNVGDLRRISHTEIKNSFGYNVTLTKV